MREICSANLFERRGIIDHLRYIIIDITSYGGTWNMDMFLWNIMYRIYSKYFFFFFFWGGGGETWGQSINSPPSPPPSITQDWLMLQIQNVQNVPKRVTAIDLKISKFPLYNEKHKCIYNSQCHKNLLAKSSCDSWK